MLAAARDECNFATMKFSFFGALLFLFGAFTACGGSNNDSCGLEFGSWSTANSGDRCQANFFGEKEYGVYCATNQDGSYDCTCGAASESPREFTSADFCDLEGKERACEAIAQCDFPL